MTTSTGVAGTESIRGLVTVGSESAWPAVTAVLGGAMVLVGLVVIVTVRRWPSAGRKYQAVTFEAADGRQSSDPADFFDEEIADDAAVSDQTDDGDAPASPPEGTGDSAPATDPAKDSAAPATGPDAPGASAARLGRPPATNTRDAAVDDWDSLTRGTDPTR